MKEHQLRNKIYYHDTDAGGVVYYATYLKHLEEGRNEYCASRGVDLRALAEQGMQFPVVHIEVDYKSPARYGDTITISSRVEKIGTSSLHFHQQISREDRLLVTAKTVWACVDGTFSIIPVPAEIKTALL
jgi:acyl-CoA thioester hydrolase